MSSEYLDFCGLSFGSSSVAIDRGGNADLFDDVLERYLIYGGMPAIASRSLTQEAHSAYIAGLYDAVVSRDILNRERGLGLRLVVYPPYAVSVAAGMTMTPSSRV